MVFLMLLRRMERGDLTAHGFRSTFRDWAAETGQPADVAEAALAHTLGDKVQAAYQRGDLLERRRKLMESWATFCARPQMDAEMLCPCVVPPREWYRCQPAGLGLAAERPDSDRVAPPSLHSECASEAQ